MILPPGVEDFRWNDFDKLIVSRGRQGGISGTFLIDLRCININYILQFNLICR